MFLRAWTYRLPRGSMTRIGEGEAKELIVEAFHMKHKGNL